MLEIHMEFADWGAVGLAYFGLWRWMGKEVDTR